MNFQNIRDKSLAVASRLGYEINSSLPLLENDLQTRPQEEIVSRSLALFAVVSCAYGLDKASALSWLARERCVKFLSPSEKLYLENDKGSVSYFKTQVECLNAFAWGLGFIEKIPFDSACSNNLIRFFPDIKHNESSSNYRKTSEVRDFLELACACDLSYCLHWAVIEYGISGQALPGKVGAHVIVERRRALEWMINKCDWDELSLDT